MPERNKLVSRAMMNTLLGDPGFIAAFPQFAPVSSSLKLASAPSRAGGCSGCRKRRIEYNAFNDFLATLRQLPADKLQELKKRVDADSLIFNVQSPRTGRYENGRL